MRVLITGGAGFIGGNLAMHLARRGDEVVCFDNLVRRGSELNLQRFRDEKNVTFVHGDIRNVDDFQNMCFVPDVVLECAAQPTAVDGYNNPYYDFSNNTLGVVNVLEFARRASAGVMFWSTNKVYGGEACNSIPVIESQTRFVWDAGMHTTGWTSSGFNELMRVDGGDHTIYGVTKLAADLLCQEWSRAFDIPVVINRLSCVYGPHQFGKATQGWVMWFILARLLGVDDITYCGFKGKQVRDCLYIDDLCDLIEKQIDDIGSHRGSCYNVGGGMKNAVSLVELNYLLDGLMHEARPKVNHLEPRKNDQLMYVSDCFKVSQRFRWKPTTALRVGLEQTITWARENIDQLRKVL